MKKLAFLLAALLAISGAAWAQLTEPTLPTPTVPAPAPGSSLGIMDTWSGYFSAVGTESTESRYSAGIFGSYIDDFVDVTWYDPNVGTFFFLGGFPADDYVENTDVLTSLNDRDMKYALSFGFARTFNSFYLGLYYGGNLVDAGTVYTDMPGDDTKETFAKWRNKAALLVGTSNYGAFRLDMIVDTDRVKNSADKDVIAQTRENGPSFALTWGGVQMAGMDPWVKLGYKFTDKFKWGDPTGNEAVYTRGSILNVEAGVNYDLDDTSSVEGSFLVGGQFSPKLKGDGEPLGMNGVNLDEKGKGSLGFRLAGAYKKTLDFGQVAVGFKPNLALGYLISNPGDVEGATDIDMPSNNIFEISLGADLGVKFQATETIALYTGAGLQIINWATLNHFGGKTSSDSKEWELQGFAWEANRYTTAGNLGFGMTVAPVENLSIGLGLNTFLDRLFVFDLVEMQAEAGTFWDDNGVNSSNNLGSWAAGLVKGMKLDLTVSYKF